MKSLATPVDFKPFSFPRDSAHRLLSPSKTGGASLYDSREEQTHRRRNARRQKNPQPAYRLQATDKTVLTFRERPSGQPEALRAWFYPGRNWGEEFVYPKAKAVELAKETNTPVLFTPVEIPLEVVEPIKTADEPVVVQLKQAPVLRHYLVRL